jgi:hypothetical protein
MTWTASPLAMVAVFSMDFQNTELPFLERPERASERARVHLGILPYANGDLSRARMGVEAAAADWRDLLIAAGLEHADRPDVLRRAGYGVP